MHFAFDSEMEKFRTEIREFAQTELPPGHLYQMMEEEAVDESWHLSMKLSKKLAEKGWLTISWPKEYGGMDAPALQQAIFCEEAGYWGIPGVSMGVSGTKWIGPSIILFGSEEQKKRHLPAISSGEEEGIWCTGYSEPDAGSDMAAMQTTAIRKGDRYIINGQKVWNSAGHRARWCWLTCRTDPTAKRKHDGLSIFLVDMQSPGVTVRQIPNIIGYHYFNEIFFKDVEVPVENRVGEENKGWSYMMKALAFERGLGLNFCGQLQRLLDELIHYVKENGLIKKNDVRNKLAELAMDVKTLRAMAYESVWKESQGKKLIYEPARDNSFSDRLWEKFGEYGTAIIGAFSQVDPLAEGNRWIRIKSAMQNCYYNAPGITIAGGTTDNLKNIIAQFGLGLPKPY